LISGTVKSIHFKSQGTTDDDGTLPDGDLTDATEVVRLTTSLVLGAEDAIEEVPLSRGISRGSDNRTSLWVGILCCFLVLIITPLVLKMRESIPSCPAVVCNFSPLYSFFPSEKSARIIKLSIGTRVSKEHHEDRIYFSCFRGVVPPGIIPF
jgi:hypothetical protein